MKETAPMPATTRRRFLGGLITALVASAALALPDAAQAARGCGSRGGPGYRRKGKCKSWGGSKSSRRTGKKRK